MIELPSAFGGRMKVQLGDGYERFVQTFTSAPPVRAVRVNTLKLSAEKFEEIAPLALDGKVPWEPSGYYVLGEGLGKTALHAAGAYYVQEPSAMCAVPALGACGGGRVLDLCAAPGGKTTQIAAAMAGQGVLIANEIEPRRCDVLKSNLERTGVKNAVALSRTPRELAGSFENYFDKILVDAPCSGEGMFRKEPNALPEWSLETVAKCAARQEEILACAHRMLAGGGRLVYSTCTFAPEEDERQIENFLRNYPEYELLEMKKLYPHEVRGEGHFCALLQKNGCEQAELAEYEPRPTKREGELLKRYREWEEETLTQPQKDVTAMGTDKFLYRKIADAPDVSRLFPRGNDWGAGLWMGAISPDGKRFEPSHRLAMSLNAREVRHIEVDERTALNYLRGLTFACPAAERGWRAVTFHGLPLGWCKAVNGVAKNHLPKGLRI